ncbi:MAG: hypothetical protein HOQ05_08365 [Corynebacteriales bacterium]|nr:hypothetical protein [Mycobacteriales bacterium]
MSQPPTGPDQPQQPYNPQQPGQMPPASGSYPAQNPPQGPQFPDPQQPTAQFPAQPPASQYPGEPQYSAQPPYQGPPPQYPGQPGQYPGPPRRNNSTRNWLIFAAVLLVLVIGGAALVWALTGDDDNKDSDKGDTKDNGESGKATEVVEDYFDAIVAEDEAALTELSCQEDISTFIENGEWRNAYAGVEDFVIEVTGEEKDGENWLVDFTYSATVDGDSIDGEETVAVVEEDNELKVCISESIGLDGP